MGKRNTRKILEVAVIVVVIALLIGGGIWFFYWEKWSSSVQIDEGKVPLSSGVVLVKETEVDKNVIPDKYNTGARGSLSNSGIGSMINGVQLASTNQGTANALDFCYKNKNVSGTVVFENVDFSEYSFVNVNEKNVNRVINVTFVNCKFGAFITGKDDGNISYRFENCTFSSYAGSNASFYRCLFTGGKGDALNPLRNCYFEGCYVSDMVHSAVVQEGHHVDGIQIFGDSSSAALPNYKISMVNCRMEIPYIPYTVSAGYMNCPITFTMNYSSASDIEFRNMYVNGGQYYTIMLHYGDEHPVSNVMFDNISVGGARKSGNIVGNEQGEIVLNNVKDTNALYVGSVWKDNGIHISVTNDTNDVRKLLVYTSEGVYREEIAACPVTHYVAKDSMDYEDFPFDIDMRFPEADWVVCYDITDASNTKQIRFVNWSGEDVYVELPQEEKVPEIEVIVPEESVSLGGVNVGADLSTDIQIEVNEETTELISGQCGKNVEYILYSDGTLVLEGTGATYNYHSGSVAPWQEYSDVVTRIKVSDGITLLGNQLFAKMDEVEIIQLPKDLEIIGANTFMGCAELKDIMLPKKISSIWNYAFHGSGLQVVMYEGSVENWEQIEIGGCNAPLIGAEVICDVGMLFGEIVAEGSCGKNVEWHLYSDGLLSLDGNGAMWNYHSKSLPPWEEYREQIQIVQVAQSITNVGNMSFKNCANLREVCLGEGVEIIGANSFAGCSSLKLIELPRTLLEVWNYAFNGVALERVVYAGTSEEWDEIEIGIVNNTLNNAQLQVD